MSLILSKLSLEVVNQIPSGLLTLLVLFLKALNRCCLDILILWLLVRFVLYRSAFFNP
jgi:hypothetical protein